MLVGEDIICFANDWEGDPLSKKQIMTLLAKHNRILWINSIGNRNPTMHKSDFQRIFKKLGQFFRGLKHVQENIWTFTPLVLPFYGSKLARGINQQILTTTIRLICRILGFRKPITWTFVPSSADVVGQLGEKLVIYHCVDEYAQFSDASQSVISQIEESLLNKSQIVIVSADKLYESKRQINPNTYLVRHGVDFEHFSRASLDSLAVPDDIAALPRPIIGFHGLIASWVDQVLIEKMALAHPEWSIVLLGKIQTHDGTRLFDPKIKNIHWLGHKKYQDLPAYCQAFDVAMIPFIVNELTINANPLKMREYLAAGLPVVSTNLPEAERLGTMVQIGLDHDHFIQQIETILEKQLAGERVVRSQQMSQESWESRVEDLSEIVKSYLWLKAITY